jgi:hypothetical protein
MRPLTKSRYKLALDCPTKLYYTNKEDEYPNTKNEDSFLQALAEGGYQVGELAKHYYPGGYDIKERDCNVPLKRTNELLKKENVVIYEAAIQYGNFFIRVDILEKKGDTINLIEVKAKSFSGTTDEFLNKKGFVNSKWSEYLEDVAFQKYVMQKAFPRWKIKAFLMLADKTKTATVDGLNQRFQLVKTKDGRTTVKIAGDVSQQALGNPVLTAVNVDDIANRIINDKAYPDKPSMSYEDKLNLYAEKYSKDEKIISQVGLHCFNCEFQTDDPTKKSGFKECWSHFYNWTDEQYDKPKITDIWNFREKQKLFEEGIISVDDLQKDHIGNITPNNDGSLSSKERQWVQIEKIQNKDDSIYFDKDGMNDYMSDFEYPLHFIDFETSMVAIPFYKGQHPYEQIAFQFSHHILNKDGSIEHKGQFIETKRGKFPNFDFIRALKEELQYDDGTIFRYATHENTVLNQIYDQLSSVSVKKVPDKEELMDFIRTITHIKNKRNEYIHKGKRDMVDMLDMVKKFYYDPRMGKSNSIKVVLPAVLNSSRYIQNKYSKPIYGKGNVINSLNYENWIWIKKDKQGDIINPYKLLPDIFEDVDDETLDSFITDDTIDDGGAALMAFAKMQFTEMTETEHSRIVNGLLRYCELDTMAMVMIYEHWLNEIKGYKQIKMNINN